MAGFVPDREEDAGASELRSGSVCAKGCLEEGAGCLG
jgi:hypothetical protein